MGNSAIHVFAAMKFRIRDGKKGRQEGMTENEYKKCFEAIMSHGGDVETRNELGQTPLHIALESANLLMFKWMLQYVRDVSEVLTTPWSADYTLLHALLELPMKVFSNTSLWFEQSPPSPHHYDVMSIINDVLLKHCDGYIRAWLRQANSNGLQPLLHAARAYSRLTKPHNCQSAPIQDFTNYVSDLIIWGCRLCTDCLTMTSLPRMSSTDHSFPLSLAYIALQIPVEEDSLQLLKKIIQLSTEKNMLKDVLAFEHDGFNLVISALKRNHQAARLILRTTKELGCVDGVHNVILRCETNPLNGEDEYLWYYYCISEKKIKSTLFLDLLVFCVFLVIHLLWERELPFYPLQTLFYFFSLNNN